MLHLFLSYAHEDAARVRNFASDLRRPGIDSWMDDELKLAGIWNDEIEERAANCDFFVPLLSKATEQGSASRFFRREWELASKGKRRVLPIRLEDCRLPAEFESRQCEDLFPSYEDGLRRILRFLHLENRTGVFEETFSCLGPDNAGWRLNGWQLDPADSTGENSQSICVTICPSRRSCFRNAPVRPLRSTSTSRVVQSCSGIDGAYDYRHRLAEQQTFGSQLTAKSSIPSRKTTRPNLEWSTQSVPLPDLGERRARLEITASAYGEMNYFPSAEAWVDDLRIA